MRRTIVGAIFPVVLSVVGLAKGSSQSHPDYLPDEKTTARVAEAVLTGQFGEERVKAQLPLMVRKKDGNQWIIQGSVFDSEGRHQVGGGFGILLNRHDGCVLELVENMK